MLKKERQKLAGLTVWLDYSNVDVHEQAMLSNKADERPTEEHEDREQNAGTLYIRECMIGKFFNDLSCVSLFDRARPFGVIKNGGGA